MGMRQWKVLLLLFLVLTVSPQRGQAQTVPDAGPVQESIQAQLEALDLGQLLKFAEVLEEEYRQFLPSLDIRDLLGGGEGMSSPGELLVLILRKFLRELYLSLHLLRQLVVIGILAALLEYLSRSFGSKAVVDLASAVSFLVLVILGLQSFQSLQMWQPQPLIRWWVSCTH